MAAGRKVPHAGPSACRLGRLAPRAARCRWSWRRLAARARARVLGQAPLGAEVVQTGRSRPTTTRPTLICRPGWTPELLGIERASVEWIERDLPALCDLVFVDCPDPDTTEERREERGEGGEEKCPATLCLSPLSLWERGRGEGSGEQKSSFSILSHLPSERQPRAMASDPAEVRRVAGDRHAAEVSQCPRGRRTCRRGARTASVFVQTHADIEADIREDWRQMLEGERGLSPLC